jgi:hypothetical protein
LRYNEIGRRLAIVFGKHQLALGFASCIALATTTILLLLILIESTGDEVYHDHNTSIAYANAQEEFRNECLGRASVQELPGCLEGIAEAARETQRAEEDLHAQVQMAKWARWMFYATLIVGVASVFVATVGILLVSETLALQRTATSEAAKATREAVEANRLSSNA